VLEADDIDVIEVQKVGGRLVRIDDLLFYLEPDPFRVLIPLLDIGDGNRETLDAGIDGREGFADVGGERGDPSLAGKIIAD